MDSERLYALIERISNLVAASERKAAGEFGLLGLHLRVLLYLSRSNRYSDTTVAVTDYLGATKGTVSQTLRLLEGKDLIRRQADEVDRRKQHYSLTSKGQRILRACLPPAPFRDLQPHASWSGLGPMLESFLRSLQRNQGSRTFGTCSTCFHFQRLKGEGEFRCGLTLEALSPEDSSKICREHRRPDAD